MRAAPATVDERAQPDSPRHDEFLRQIEFYEVFQPRAVVIEQPPPTATTLPEYTALSSGMQAIGYHCQARVLNCAEHGDYTSRRRWFLVCLRYNGAIEWPTPRLEFEGLDAILDDPKTVCPARFIPATETFVPRRERVARRPTHARKLGSYLVNGRVDEQCVRVYDEPPPLPSAAVSQAALLGSPGGLIRGKYGDYNISNGEVARAHGFSQEALDQVERLTSTSLQWRWVANSLPRRTAQAVLEAVLDSMHSPKQLGVQDAGPIGSHSDIAECAARRHLQSALRLVPSRTPQPDHSTTHGCRTT